ncbi:MAG TPA: rhodanese-like domain-containing protein [Bacillota bacterium]
MGVQDLTSEEVQRLLQIDDNLEIIDVREQEEVKQGTIENAKHIPLGEIPFVLNKLPKNKHYIIICRSGRRSMMAAQYMNEKGYQASNLKGGMLEWTGEIFFG